MKLIGMTDFVLQESTSIESVYNYAMFLKQPLTLGMFVPTDEAGNVLDEPSKKDMEWFKGLAYGDFSCDYTRIFEFIEAKERVLFEGFELVNENYHIFVQSDKLDIRFSKKDKSIDSFRFKYIEDLTSRNLTLTETAIKQIGL